ncbi:hypothetical protein FA95DRAFT_335184 [Auriscalpium vulgare]|uniref:Uncharacterized protein n=1 Tax=Auriscalpium vulgare TaxID=40419 RepID=A0ACB8RJ34_9AGAM|nr:hypothetical protein FA95DRAFT_335184 [Auriscalpium vulgare]
MRCAPPRPLKRLAHPSTLAIEILPRQPAHPSHTSRRTPIPPDSTTLHASDSLRLTLTAFGDTHHLHLRPNEHLVHPAARIAYYDTTPDGQSVLARTEPLLADGVRAYTGEVIPAHASAERMRADAARALPAHTPGALGWARILVHDTGDARAGRAPLFEGAFSVRGVTHHVMTRANYLRNRHPLDPHVELAHDDPEGALVVWREVDTMNPWEEHAARTGTLVDYAREVEQPRRCGHDNHAWNADPEVNPVLRAPSVSPWQSAFGFMDSPFADLLRKRDDIAGPGMTTNFANTIGQNAGCPKEQKVLYLGVAADCEYVNHYGSQPNATTQILNIFNMASVLYKSTFNVSLGIIELQIQNSTCPTVADPAVPWNVNCSSNATLDDRLSLFSQWRGNKGNDSAGLWHLMSNCPTGTEVGVAWLATLCSQKANMQGSSFVSGTAVSTAGRTEWQVVSHEIGHNFGAIHDCADGCNSTSSCCPLSTSSCDANSQFLMSPVATDGEMVFSQCTIGNICSLMQAASGSENVNTSCLLPPDPTRTTISLQMCGNGIVEAGEDCDPGRGVNSTCCDTTTCKFTAGSQCDPGSSACCTGSCQFAGSGQVCRPAKDPSCDTPEVCTGNSSACPTDVFAPNGQSCGSGGLACASGQCTSISQQCKQLGTSMNLQDACPNQNDNTCQVSCSDPTSLNRCVILDSTLIDGSPCGYGGTCLNSKCQAGSLLDTAKAWYVQNLQISIPVTIVAALILILLLYWIASCLCGGRPPPPMTYAQTVPQPRSMGPAPAFVRIPSQTGGGPSAPGPALQRAPSAQSHWVDTREWNGPPR